MKAALGTVAVALLLVAACSGDDSKDSSDTTLPTAVCDLLSFDQLNAATGETFTKSERLSDDQCEYSSEERTAVIRLAVHTLGDDEPVDDFMDAGRKSCDDGTLDEDHGIQGIDPGFICLAEGKPLVAGVHDGTVYLLQGITQDETVEPAQVIAALKDLLPESFHAQSSPQE